MKFTEGMAVRAWPLYLALLVLLATVASHLSLLQYAAGCRGTYPLSSSSSGISAVNSSDKSSVPAAAELAGVGYTLSRQDISRNSGSSPSSSADAATVQSRSSSQSIGGVQSTSSHLSDDASTAAAHGEALHPAAAASRSNGPAAAADAAALAHGAQRSVATLPAAGGDRSADDLFNAGPGALSQAADSAPTALAGAARREVAPSAAAAAATAAAGVQAVQPPLPRIFVGVLSESRNFAARQAIRQTWGSDPRLTRVVFFILRPRTQRGVHLLRQEASDFGDLIVTSEVLESYYNCTHSVLTMLKAAAAMGPSVDYMVKTDDDAYVRVTPLLEALRDLPRQRLYSGYGMRAIPTPRSGTWAISYDTWPHDMTAPYSYGLGYVLSMDLVRQMAAGAFHAAMDADNLIRIEDVAIGVAVEATAAWDGTAVHYDTSMRYALKGCEEGAVFVQVPKVRQGWRVHAHMMRCMYSRSGRCCAPQEQQQQRRQTQQLR